MKEFVCLLPTQKGESYEAPRSVVLSFVEESPLMNISDWYDDGDL